MKSGFMGRIRAAYDVVVGKSAFAQAFLTGRDITGMDWNLGKMVRPYEQSAWINRAIQLKVDEITRVPLKFYDGESEFTDPTFLAWWRAPFLGQNRRPLALIDARKQLASWPDLGGEYFIVLGDDWLNPFASRSWKSLERPIIARPDRMRHVVTNGELMGWVFTDAAGHQHTLLPEQVIHSPLWNPYDDWRGLATVKVVLNAAEADYLAGVYVRNLMRNNGDQGVFVIAKNGVVSDEQREQIVASLREKRMKSLRGDFAPAFLTGDITVEDPKAQAPNADLNAGRLLSRHEIFLGLGVPPAMSDVKASYSIGADSDRFALITGTSMPLSSRVDAGLTLVASIMMGRVRAVNGLWEPSGPLLEAETDWDDHPVMQQVRRERVDTALKLWGTGMPMESANEYLDLGMQEFEGWDQGYLPFNVAPVAPVDATAPAKPADPIDAAEFDEDAADDEDPETAGDSQDDPDDEDPDVKTVRLLMLAKRRQAQTVARRQEQELDELRIFACACHGSPLVAAKDRDAARVALARKHLRSRLPSVKEFHSRISRELMTARIETLKKIDLHRGAIDAAASKKAVQKAAAADLVFNEANFRAGLLASLRKQAAITLETAGQQVYDEIGRDDPFKMASQDVLAYVRDRENKLSGVSDEVHQKIKDTLQEGIEAGDTADQLAGRVKGAFNEINAGRARTIASTETSAAFGAGRDKAMKDAGIEWKEWLTSGNANVRPAHAAAEGQIVRINEPYNVDGEPLMFPGDSAGSPGNVINCHCVSIPKAKGP